MDVYYYILHVVTNMVTVAMVNFVNKMQKSEVKGPPSPMSTILITERYIWYVYVDLQLLSAKLLFYIIFR